MLVITDSLSSNKHTCIVLFLSTVDYRLPGHTLRCFLQISCSYNFCLFLVFCFLTHVLRLLSSHRHHWRPFNDFSRNIFLNVLLDPVVYNSFKPVLNVHEADSDTASLWSSIHDDDVQMTKQLVVIYWASYALNYCQTADLCATVFCSLFTSLCLELDKWFLPPLKAIVLQFLHSWKCWANTE